MTSTTASAAMPTEETQAAVDMDITSDVPDVEEQGEHSPEKATSSQTQSHVLKSLKAGNSEIEQLADRIEKRRENRIPVTFKVRLDFLRSCKLMAEQEGHRSKISLRKLKEYRDQVQERLNRQHNTQGHYFRQFLYFCGFRNNNAVLLKVLERGIERVNEVDDDWFHFQDFSFYYTKLESRWPWLRSSASLAAIMVFFFYLFTPILFCHIVKDKDVCPKDPDGNKAYYGWLTALYFASATMSTVGYGDITIDKSTRWRVFIGILYMILALVVVILALGAAAEKYFSVFSDLNEKIVRKLTGNLLEGELLHQRIRRVKTVKIMEVIIQFTLLNVIGMLVARIFIRASTNPDEKYTWMTTLYWAVQTTTTIGYGDVAMPYSFHWFQVFYLIVSTYFVGSALGKLGDLKTELLEIRRLYAWQRREVSKGMIEDMQAYDHDDVVDQYEFVISSLLTLGKIQSEDIVPIMNRFRQLAGENGVINMTSSGETDESSKEDNPNDRGADL